MAFEMPHKHDLAIDGQTLRGQMIENFEAIEQALADTDDMKTKLDKLQKALGLSDDDLKEL
ncbi:hypothetical protein FOL80_04835 [Lactobacillus reuteri]|uniref:hypothetical protein n=1 Tax=Limosilactobacillus reuteri TaxID=1598 RepID=UPI00146B29E7|nr:hypothetical protein [Limosilactobacillus reuteri]NMV48482.1 hypothetical protein [Limosilactobacillus reuteri]NMV50187.1 hypothetical protein [Limosilactobacillus reuteri]NMV59772.1 hypothetical protein [Limosilactobacillus reuteri]NMV61373.1 hypothetical protein [Limosilactobacillus reuteri]NMV63332.1 hypothetical protein [Limosilactobacillus reuteri]